VQQRGKGQGHSVVTISMCCEPSGTLSMSNSSRGRSRMASSSCLLATSISGRNDRTLASTVMTTILRDTQKEKQCGE
jgi:hypothetical protein